MVRTYKYLHENQYVPHIFNSLIFPSRIVLQNSKSRRGTELLLMAPNMGIQATGYQFSAYIC